MRARGCLIAAAIALGVVAIGVAVFGPTLVREGRRVAAPISRMKSSQEEFEKWVRDHPWKDPEAPALDESQLARFLALRKEVRRFDEAVRDTHERLPENRKPSMQDITGLLEGVGEAVTERLAAFHRAGMTPDEYAYLERLVYRRWLAPLREAGVDPAARGRAAAEIEQAAEAERNATVSRRLRQVAGELRQRRAAAPEGIPESIHELLWSRAPEIEGLA